ncbi:MAG TPA: hypothetical protein DIT33_00900 [Pseudomonas sp.]|nr:hypothetical protein [Pseudomonas sp.]
MLVLYQWINGLFEVVFNWVFMGNTARVKSIYKFGWVISQYFSIYLKASLLWGHSEQKAIKSA